MKPLLALLASTLLTVGVTACGGGSEETASGPSTSASSVTSTAGAPATPTANGATSATPPPSSSAGTGSSSGSDSSSSASSLAKRYPHGDNSIQTFGKESGEADKQAVTTVVKRYYAAVAAGDGAGACALLSSGISKSIVQSLGRSAALREKGCPGILSLLFKHRPGQAGASLAVVDVTGVRVKGNRGFALLRSKTMPSGEITIYREGGAWKIGSLIGSALP
jgi:hypothetical protein